MVVGLGEVYGDGKDHDADDGALRMPFAFSTNRGRRSHQLGGSTKVMTRQVNSACAAELGRVGAVSSLLSSWRWRGEATLGILFFPLARLAELEREHPQRKNPQSEREHSHSCGPWTPW
jgi:hypothetical protein